MDSDADAALALALQLEEEEAVRQEQQQAAAHTRVDEVAQNLSYGLTLAAKHLSPASLAAARAVTPIDRLRRESKQAVLEEEEKEKEKKREAEESDNSRGGGGGGEGATRGGGRRRLTETRALLDGLLSWFKRDFFEWIDSPKCERCDVLLASEPESGSGSGSCSGSSSSSTITGSRGKEYKEKKDRSTKECVDGAAAPTALERSLGCGRVELWSCSGCRNPESLRFPRHNDVPTLLLGARGGRCGEFANAFTAVCNAAGLEARLVLDFSDHVWTEVFDPDQRRWLHADPCEAAADEPLLYELGWGKEPARAVVAFSAHPGDPRAADVTPRYTRLRGAELEENRLRGGAGFTGEQLRAAAARAGAVPLGGAGGGGGGGGGALAAAAAAAAAERRRAADEEELSGGKATAGKIEAAAAAAAAAALPARTAGDAEWIRSRGEDGKKEEELPTSSSSSAAAAADTGADTSATAAAVGGEDFASEIRREFERLRVAEPELAPNDAAVRALQRVTEKAKEAAAKAKAK